MKIIKFDNFLVNEDVKQDMEQRVQQLEQVRNKVRSIVNVAPAIQNLNDIEQIDNRLEQLSNQYQNEEDSMVSLALTLINKVGDRKKLEIQMKLYEEEIPELQNQIDERLQSLMQEIENLKNT